MKEEFNVYETLILFDGNLTKEEIGKAEKDYYYHINNGTGDTPFIPAYVHDIVGLGKKELSYVIEGRTHAHYTKFIYSTKQERISELERIMRIDDKVLKYMTIKLREDEVAEVDTDKVINENLKRVYKDEEEKKQPVDIFDLIFNIEKEGE